MPGTMDKKDIKLSFDPLSTVKWDKVQATAGKAVPQLCKTTVQEVLDGVKTKKYKKPYGKVGLIKKDLWFRIKDGSTHVDDILLVKNWSEPDGATVELTSQQTQALKAWIKSRQDLLTTCENGLEAAKPLLKTLQSGCARIETFLDMAKQGITGTTTGSGSVANADTAKDLLQDLQNTVDSIQQIHDRDVFPDYEQHRTITGPDKGLGLPPDSYADYTKTFYLQTVGPVYKSITDITKQAAALLETAKKQYLLIVKWSSEASSSLDNYKDEAQDVLDEMNEEFTKMKAEEGMSPFSNIENGLKTDTENLATYDPTLLDRLLDNATGKITKAKETMKRILVRKATVEQQLNRVKAFPKPVQSNTEVKSIIVQIATLFKSVGEYVKEQQTFLVAGDKQFQKFKKAYEKIST